MRIERLLIGMLLLVPFFGTSQPIEKACFSISGGFYEESPILELFPFYPQHHIRFTTNGNRPTAQSRLYTEPLLLDGSLFSESDIYTINLTPDSVVFVPDSVRHCIVIRAAVFDENDSCVSEIATNSYFIHSLGCYTHGLPVISLCADTLDLFDEERGILVPGVSFDPQFPNVTGNYYQTGRDWERPVNFEYYENLQGSVNQLAGLRVHGKLTRRIQQKALKVYARTEYGKNHFDYPFFDATPIESFKHLTLKPFSASPNQTGINDYIANNLASRLNVESLASRPVVLFLNGEYWGIYFLHEKPDSRYLEEHFGLDADSVTIIEGWDPLVDCGNPVHFNELFNWISMADLRDSTAYAYVTSKINIDNFIDYCIFELFAENTDWPNNNMRCWQYQDQPWRWIFFDGDACFCWMTFFAFDNIVYEGDATWPSSVKASLFFRKLFENENFKEQFNTRFLELLDTDFSSTVTMSLFEEIKQIIEPEIPFQSERFHYPENVETWYQNLVHIQWFLMNRHEYILAKLDDFMPWSLPVKQESHLEVFPNPFTSGVTLRIESERAKTEQCSVYDLLGHQVFSQTVALTDGVNNISIPFQLAPGLYYLKIDAKVIKIIRQ